MFKSLYGLMEEFLVACQGQLWQLELLGAVFWGWAEQLISYWGQ